LRRSDPDTFFTTDHYRGYPTVLVRLSEARVADLCALLEQEGLRMVARGKRLFVQDYERFLARLPQ